MLSVKGVILQQYIKGVGVFPTSSSVMFERRGLNKEMLTEQPIDDEATGVNILPTITKNARTDFTVTYKIKVPVQKQ